MTISELQQPRGVDNNIKLKEKFLQLNTLLVELRKRELPSSIVISINYYIDELNLTSKVGNELRKLLNKRLTMIIELVEKELKLAPKNYYRNYWQALGIAVFGLPMGVVFGFILDNMSYIGIGLPIGFSIGMAVGASMDKKALEEGRQLNIDITE